MKLLLKRYFIRRRHLSARGEMGYHWRAKIGPTTWPSFLIEWWGDAGSITTQLGTPRGRYDEHSIKSFPQ
jgi:hypothetical protein